ncbi:MAG TPA: hypothetical protein VLJ18_08930 [Thermoanaerobaculia bacterium]|nr:hypothetical protein [Thermoanaerobaculia bacterium]
MPHSRLAAPALFAALAVSCGRGPREPQPAPGPPAADLLALPLSPGLILALDPNLPGVDGEDLPESTRREVEVLEFGKGGLRLRWSGRVRIEKPDSSRRREEWVRARANAPQGATPVAAPPAAYESREVGGTLLFPDFATATEFLLPGLWPEGAATIAGSSALWISPNAFAELKAAGRATVPFSLSSNLLRDPAASLLKRAYQLSSEASSGPPHLWTRETETDFSLRVDGIDSRVRALGARNWFGAYTVLEAEGPPLVLSVTPGPVRSPGLDLFAPASVLRSLLGYRVAEVIRLPRRDS